MDPDGADGAFPIEHGDIPASAMLGTTRGYICNRHTSPADVCECWKNIGFLEERVQEWISGADGLYCSTPESPTHHWLIEYVDHQEEDDREIQHEQVMRMWTVSILDLLKVMLYGLYHGKSQSNIIKAPVGRICSICSKHFILCKSKAICFKKIAVLLGQSRRWFSFTHPARKRMLLMKRILLDIFGARTPPKMAVAAGSWEWDLLAR